MSCDSSRDAFVFPNQLTLKPTSLFIHPRKNKMLYRKPLEIYESLAYSQTVNIQNHAAEEVDIKGHLYSIIFIFDIDVLDLQSVVCSLCRGQL